MDVSFPNLMVCPPFAFSLNGQDEDVATNEKLGMVRFNGAHYVYGGRYALKIIVSAAPNTLSISTVKDFGAGENCTDAAVFNGKIYWALGSTTKMWESNNADTFVQASDNTFAYRLTVVGKALYRVETSNVSSISYALTAPLTLANWTPAAGSEFQVGTTNHDIDYMYDFGGVPFCFKFDGGYLPDEVGEFKNQIPQFDAWQNVWNGRNAFKAQGALFIPSENNGLIRYRRGEAIPVGPEQSGMEGYYFRVLGGVAIQDDIYLLVMDKEITENCKIIKMELDREGYTDNEYRYHDIYDVGKVRLHDTRLSGFLFAITTANNPILIWPTDTNLATFNYIALGQGNGGRDIDDPNYYMSGTGVLETGVLAGGDDLSVESTLVGVSVLANLPDKAQYLDMFVKRDEESTWQEMTESQEKGDALNAIRQTDGYESVIRYAPRPFRGHLFEFKFELHSGTTQGTTDRAEVREAWAYGYSHPRIADVLTIAINLDESRVAGIEGKSKKREHILNYWRNLIRRGETVEISLPGYEPTNKTRFIPFMLQDGKFSETASTDSGSYATSVATIKLIRVDFGEEYATEPRGF
jgi:hypothetical protein